MKNKIGLIFSIGISIISLCCCDSNNPSDIYVTPTMPIGFEEEGWARILECQNCFYSQDAIKIHREVGLTQFEATRLKPGDGPYVCPNCHEKSLYAVTLSTARDVFKGELSIYNQTNTTDCPKVENVYSVNTLMKFALTIRSNKGGKYTGNVIDFDEVTSSDPKKDDAIYYTSFGTYQYDNSFEDTTYILTFSKKGSYVINLHQGDYKATVSVNCDNNADVWSDYYVDISTVYPWMATLSPDNVIKIREKSGGYGTEPSMFQNVKYSTSKNDITSACKLLNAKILKDENFETPEGGGYAEYTYFTNSGSYTCRLNYGMYVSSSSGSEQSMCLLMDTNDKPEIKEENQVAYSFLSSPKIVGVDAINLSSISTMIDYFDKIDFVEWGNVGMDQQNATYVINEFGMDQLFIYDEVRFKFRNVFYRVVSDQNFTSLFRF